MKKINVTVLLVVFMFLSGCAGYIPYGTATLKAHDKINFKVNTFSVTQASELQMSYKNHFNQRILDRFKKVLEKKLVQNGFVVSDKPDIEIRITEFSLVNKEIISLTFDMRSDDTIYRTTQYRPKVGPGYYQGVSYFRATPGIGKATDIILVSIMRRIKR